MDALIKQQAIELIKEYASEYVEEMCNSQLAEEDEGFYTYVGDKHYFEFELIEEELAFLGISDIVYFD